MAEHRDCLPRTLALGGNLNNGVANISIIRSNNLGELAIALDDVPFIFITAKLDGTLRVELAENHRVVYTGNLP